MVESRPLARRLADDGIATTVADPKRVDSYLRADVNPNTCVIVEDNQRRGLKRIVTAIRDAGGSLLYILHVDAAPTRRSQDDLRGGGPDVTHLDLAELLAPTLTTELGRSLTRARVQQYQRYFADADRVLILLHNEPDPDALAAGLALRNVLRRTRTTAIIGALQGVTRPENLRMADLLDIQVETIKPEDFASFDRIATVDVQPHYFGGLLPRVDLVVDHHPEQPGYAAVFKDIRSDYGSTCTILTEHLRAIDVNISERTATAMLYAIKSDTLFFARQTNRTDLEAFSFLYPLVGPGAHPQDGGRRNHARAARARHAGPGHQPPAPSGLLGVPRRDLARRLHPLHRRLPAAGRGREVDDRLRHRRRTVRSSQRAQPRLLAQRGRVREDQLRRHRQRRRAPRHGQGGHADRPVPRQVRRPVGRGHRGDASANWPSSSCTTRSRRQTRPTNRTRARRPTRSTRSPIASSAEGPRRYFLRKT